MSTKYILVVEYHCLPVYDCSMQLTLYTDYSLRVLLYLGQHPNERATITQISEYFNVSRNHLVKVVHTLGKLGLIHTIRGKSGGMVLAEGATDIDLATIVQRIEPHMNLLECFDDETNTCPVTMHCGLKHILFKAKKSFLEELKAYTLADLLPKEPVKHSYTPIDVNIISIHE